LSRHGSGARGGWFEDTGDSDLPLFNDQRPLTGPFLTFFSVISNTMRPPSLPVLRLAGCFLALLLATPQPILARQPSEPRVLLVTAHPDDDALFAATVYRITHHLNGKVDLALITDGSGGYRYSTLAEPIYGRTLTDEAVARQYLPAIRKQELMAGGSIVGIRKYFFLDQPDLRYTLNVDSVFSDHWDAEFVWDRLGAILEEGAYDFVFTFVPLPETHGAHKGAAISALRAVNRMPPENRPVVLASFIRSASETTPLDFTELPGYPLTRLNKEIEPFSFDRNRPIGIGGRLNYKIIVNWLIAEHKSQGTMQLLMNRGDEELFWVYAMNGPDAEEKARAFFNRLNTDP